MTMKCTKALYRSYLAMTSVRHSGVALSEVSPIERLHDSVSDWLQQWCSIPSMVCNETKPLIGQRKGLLIFDDSVMDKKHKRLSW